MPSQFKVRFVDGTEYHATFILPPAEGADGYLSQDDLDNVARGFNWTIIGAVTPTVITA